MPRNPSETGGLGQALFSLKLLEYGGFNADQTNLA